MSLQTKIQNLPLDKKEHVIVGVAYSILIPLFCLIGLFISQFTQVTDFTFWGATLGFCIGTYFNLWKELYNDKYKKRGNAELNDFIATQTPILITYITFLIN